MEDPRWLKQQYSKSVVFLYTSQHNLKKETYISTKQPSFINIEAGALRVRRRDESGNSKFKETLFLFAVRKPFLDTDWETEEKVKIIYNIDDTIEVLNIDFIFFFF